MSIIVHVSFTNSYVYALSTSKIFHRVVTSIPNSRPHFGCNFNQPIHDLMRTRLMDGTNRTPDVHGDRLCRRCFP